MQVEQTLHLQMGREVVQHQELCEHSGIVLCAVQRLRQLPTNKLT